MKIRIHPLFILILAVAGFTGSGRLLLLNFISVVLHEIAHAAVAWAFSYRTYRIELYPFGGVAIMDAALMGDGLAEALTALAGPCHSLLFAALSFWGGIWLGVESFGNELAKINLTLGLFNLVPFFPLDGGRILRALLIPALGLRDATRLTSGLTRWTAGITLIPAVLLMGCGRLPWSVPLVIFLLLWASRDIGDHLYLRWRQGEKRRRRLEEGSLVPVTVRAVNEEMSVKNMGTALDGRAYKLFLTTDGSGRVNGWVDETKIWETLMSGSYGQDFSLAKIKTDLVKRGVPFTTVERGKNINGRIDLFSAAENNFNGNSDGGRKERWIQSDKDRRDIDASGKTLSVYRGRMGNGEEALGKG